MQLVNLTYKFSVSQIIYGIMRIQDLKYDSKKLSDFITQINELGIDTFDSADIYGNYECEKAFGNALAQKPFLRNKIKIISKCGIKLLSDKFPERKAKHYDYSYDHITQSVDKSLKDLRTSYVDLLLLHRPSPFFNPQEVAKAFTDLKQRGKVLNFGVSNFLQSDIELLQSYTEEKLITNQIEISALNHEHFDNGNINYLMQKKIKPMSWSPIGEGKIFRPKTEKEFRVFNELNLIAAERNESIDKIAYAWLLSHPAQIIPVVGSGKIERIKSAIESINIKLSTEEWFRIYSSAKGVDVP